MALSTILAALLLSSTLLFLGFAVLAKVLQCLLAPVLAHVMGRKVARNRYDHLRHYESPAPFEKPAIAG